MNDFTPPGRRASGEGAAPERLRVLLADGQPLLREGVRAVLRREDDMEVVGDASDGSEVPGLVEQLQPDVVVVDLMIPGSGGLEVTREVRRRFPETQVLVLSMHDDQPYVLEAFQRGAAGYLLMRVSASEVVRAVREVAAGRRYLGPPLADRAVEAYARRAQPISGPYETLTHREREVLALVAEGNTNAAIAAQLFISHRTVETHRANAMKKLGLHTSAELVRFALCRGIISSDT